MFDGDVLHLKRNGIDLEQLGNYEILCLPENSETATSSAELFDASDSIVLSKMLKGAGAKCANSFDVGISTPTLDRRSDELWLGLIWLMSDGAWPFLINVASNMFTDRIKGVFSSSTVHVKLRWRKGENLEKLDYDGDGATLLKVLESIQKTTEKQK